MSSNKTSTATTKKAPATNKATTKKAGSSSTAAAATEQKPKVATPAKTVEKKETTEPKKATAPRRKASPKAEAPATENAENAENVETEQQGGEASEQKAETSTKSKTESEPMSVEKLFADLLNRKKEQGRMLREEVQMLRELKMAFNRQMRDMNKKKKNNRQSNKDGTQKKPSGFAQPSRIREALCDFLGLEHGSSIARTEVTGRVIEYIQGNELEDKTNRRNIVPDDALEKLVGNAEERLRTMEARKKELEEISARFPDDEKKREKAEKCVVTDKLTYFNLQVHLNKHFIKEDRKKIAAPTQESTEESTVVTANA